MDGEIDSEANRDSGEHRSADAEPYAPETHDGIDQQQGHADWDERQRTCKD